MCRRPTAIAGLTPRPLPARWNRPSPGWTRAGHGLAGIILCPAFVNEGFPTLPPGWLDPALALVRAAGGIVIADEVQPGFGRVGSHFWGHLRMGFAPDVVDDGQTDGQWSPRCRHCGAV